MRLLCRMLAIIGPAMFAGVMLAIGVILGNYWKSLPPEQFLAWFAHNGGYIQKAIPPVVLPTLIGLASMIDHYGCLTAIFLNIRGAFFPVLIRVHHVNY